MNSFVLDLPVEEQLLALDSRRKNGWGSIQEY